MKIMIVLMLTLTKKEKETLESRHKQSRDGRERDRIKAVLLSDEGWSSLMISQALRKHETSINRHLNEYRTNQKLTIESGSSESHLNTEQTRQLIQHLCQKTYGHQHQIVAYIEQVFSVKYSISGLNKWLHKNGFSYKKPKGVPHKFDEKKQAEFIEKYKTIKNSLKDDEPLLFMDAVHPTQATKITHGWIQKGLDKSIETTGSRTRLNIVGAIRLGHLTDTIVEQYKTVNGESIVDFLKKTRQCYSSSGIINLVLDGAGYHRSKLVVDEAKKQNITLHYLPPYSPNLNPIERLWKVMNEYARNNQYFATAKLFRESIEKFFKLTLPDIADSLDSRINDNFQKLESRMPAF